jgi:hypothetical protein
MGCPWRPGSRGPYCISTARQRRWQNTLPNALSNTILSELSVASLAAKYSAARSMRESRAAHCRLCALEGGRARCALRVLSLGSVIEQASMMVMGAISHAAAANQWTRADTWVGGERQDRTHLLIERRQERRAISGGVVCDQYLRSTSCRQAISVAELQCHGKMSHDTIFTIGQTGRHKRTDRHTYRQTDRHARTESQSESVQASLMEQGSYVWPPNRDQMSYSAC